MKKITLFLFVFSLGIMVQAQEQKSSYEATLLEMFSVSGTEEAYKVAIVQTMGMLKSQYSNVDATVWKDLEKEFLKTSLNDLVTLLVPVYQKELTEGDLNAIIDFYKTPAGKKFAEKNPIIMQESMKVGQQWGMEIGMKFAKKMKEKGY